jgi:Acyl-CoA reductase (LuxC)
MRSESAVDVTHVVAGRAVTGGPVEYPLAGGAIGLRTPEVDLDALAAPRSVPGPAFDVPLREIVEFLVATGKELTPDNPHLRAALDSCERVTTMPRRILERQYAVLPEIFTADVLEEQIDAQVGIDAIDGWRPVVGRSARRSAIRAFPPRLVHVLAGNSPLVAGVTIAWTALLKGTGLMKMPSNDPFTAAAILRVMAELDAYHPVVRSLAAVYWRGGDTAIEGALFRPQFFDKIAAWGGEQSIRQAQRYTGPGLELVSFDPKTSISLVGAEAFATPDALAAAAELAAIDTTFLNQDACASSRVHYVEGSRDEADTYCEALLPALAREREFASPCGDPTPADIRDEVEILRGLEPDFRVLGDYSGSGLVVRSDEPLGFYPEGRTVNVVPVPSLVTAAHHATVATQSAGVYPCTRKVEVRDALAARGVQRIVDLGDTGVIEAFSGLPHDGFYALTRLARWVVDQGGRGTESA